MPLSPSTLVRAVSALSLTLLSWTALAQQEPLRIGLLTVKTGVLAGPGKQMEDGLRYFLKERSNLLAGRQIELVVADSVGQAAVARSKVQELVERSKVAVIIGPLASTEQLAIDDYVREAKVPSIMSSALAEDLTQRMVNPWMIRATGTSGQLAHPLGDYAAKTLGYKRIAIIATDFAYGHEVTAAFQRVFEDSGGKIVQKIWVPPTATDFAAYVTQIKKDIDAVYSSFSGASANAFVRQYAEYGLKAKIPLLASQTTVDESLLKEQGSNALGIISGAIYSAAIESPENQKFVAEFRAQTGAEPGFYSVGAYTAGLLLEAALKTTKGRTDDREALMRALRTARVEASPRGEIALDAYGNPVASSFIRKTERREGRLQNTVIKTYPSQSQFWTYDPKKFLADPVYSRSFPVAKNIEQ
ncbi:ABC transporter substrate-binding protein [Variovorax sp. EL159]|uniref:ABC transporter substrate-binding protein n=1 Tax=Variovorax sp. EL159 TaxID=1566270 RepID=UPI00087EA41B|nr:ABC transporter substrate-binding protein [Variovorax sp. EL159]SCX72517.1 branched-chain amino acid transport system substrate-binding protein [Variovorax sp. EL159]